MEEYAKSSDVSSETFINGRRYLRIALSTPDFTENEDLPAYAAQYTADRLKPDDILVLRADAVSISQGRIFAPDQPVPQKSVLAICKWGKKLSKSPIYENPRILEALRHEYASSRVTFAALIGILERPFFGKDWFYRIAGNDCRFVFEVSGAQKSSVPAGSLILPPENADTLVNEIAEAAGCRVVIADLRPERESIRILAASESYLNLEELEQILIGAPMRVGLRRVPLCIIRAV